MDGFDFNISETGEMEIDGSSHDAKVIYDNKQKAQMAFTRIKSVSHNWFYDNIGANLEAIIGLPCNADTAGIGKEMIINVLTEDDLFQTSNVRIVAEIKNRTEIYYEVYLRFYQDDDEESECYKISLSLDLVRGIKIRYGWKSRGDF